MPFSFAVHRVFEYSSVSKKNLVLDDENINVCSWYVKQVLRAFDDQASKHLSPLVK